MSKTMKTKPLPYELEFEDPMDEAEEIIPFTYSITSYGADYPVDSLVRRINTGDIMVPTFSQESLLPTELDSFQREYIWQRSKADRFIESLLLGLPVPGIFLVKDPSERLLVLDGHQRLHTLQSFVNGAIDNVDYRLTGIQKRFVGKSYSTLMPEDRRRLDDSIIHATVVKQDHPSDDWSSVYTIFERLNTGGVTLQPQEIRSALYHGEFAKCLRMLNTNSNWRLLLGGAPNPRLKDVELVLRFLALFYKVNSYDSTMKHFLNNFMFSNKDLQRYPIDDMTRLFDNTTEIILTALGDGAFRPERAINAAFTDAVMVGVARACAGSSKVNPKHIAKAHKKLLTDEDFLAAITTGTSQPKKVKFRISQAIKAFSQ